MKFINTPVYRIEFAFPEIRIIELHGTTNRKTKRICGSSLDFEFVFILCLKLVGIHIPSCFLFAAKYGYLQVVKYCVEESGNRELDYGTAIKKAKKFGQFETYNYLVKRLNNAVGRLQKKCILMLGH